MSLTAKSTNTETEPVPEGVHVGCCYLVSDLGHQLSEKYGTEKRAVVIGFELPEIRITVERDGQPKDLPRAASRRFTLSLGEKAELRKFLQSWRGKSFTEQELQGFDLKNLLGAPALVQIVHEHKPDGRTVARIASVMALPKGTPRPKPENEPQWFSFEECDPTKPFTFPANLPEWIVKTLEQSREWKERSAAASAPASTPAPAAVDAVEDEEPLPF